MQRDGLVIPRDPPLARQPLHARARLRPLKYSHVFLASNAAVAPRATASSPPVSAVVSVSLLSFLFFSSQVAIKIIDKTQLNPNSLQKVTGFLRWPTLGLSSFRSPAAAHWLVVAQAEGKACWELMFQHTADGTAVSGLPVGFLSCRSTFCS